MDVSRDCNQTLYALQWMFSRNVASRDWLVIRTPKVGLVIGIAYGNIKEVYTQRRKPADQVYGLRKVGRCRILSIHSKSIRVGYGIEDI